MERGTSNMEMCAIQHEQIVFERGDCPLCMLIDSTEKRIKNMEDVYGINLSIEMLPAD